MSPAIPSVWVVCTSDAEPFALEERDARTGARVAAVELHGAIPDDDKSLAVGLGAVWVASGHQVVHRVNTAARRVEKTIEIGHHLGRPAVCAGAVWVPTDRDGGRVVRIDPATNAIAGSVPLAYPRQLAAHGDALWVSHGPRLTRVDPRTLRSVETHDLGGIVLGLTAGLGAVWAATVDETPVGAPRGAPETGLLFRVMSAGPVPVARITGRAAGLAAGTGGVWVAAARLERLDAETAAVTASFDERVAAPTPVGDALWAVRQSYAGDDGEIVRVDPGAGDLAVLAAGTRAHAMAAG